MRLGKEEEKETSNWNVEGQLGNAKCQNLFEC